MSRLLSAITLLALAAITLAGVAGAATSAGYHWQRAGLNVTKKVVVTDNTNDPMYQTRIITGEQAWNTRQNKVAFGGNGGNETGYYLHQFYAPAECDINDWLENYPAPDNSRPCVAQGKIQVYDWNWGTVPWAGLTRTTQVGDHVWGIGIFFNSYPGYANDPVNTVCHEFGHAIGLGHNNGNMASCLNDNVLPSANVCKNTPTSCPYPAPDDITLVNSIYNHATSSVDQRGLPMTTFTHINAGLPKGKAPKFHWGRLFDLDLMPNTVVEVVAP